MCVCMIYTYTYIHTDIRRQPTWWLERDSTFFRTGVIPNGIAVQVIRLFAPRGFPRRYEDLVARPTWWLETLLHFLQLEETATGRHHAALTRSRAAQLQAHAAAPDPRTHLHTIVSGGFVSRLEAGTVGALLRELRRHPIVLSRSGYF